MILCSCPLGDATGECHPKNGTHRESKAKWVPPIVAGDAGGTRNRQENDALGDDVRGDYPHQLCFQMSNSFLLLLVDGAHFSVAVAKFI